MPSHPRSGLVLRRARADLPVSQPVTARPGTSVRVGQVAEGFGEPGQVPGADGAAGDGRVLGEPGPDVPAAWQGKAAGTGFDVVRRGNW